MKKTKVKEVALIIRGCHTDPKEKDKSNMNDSNKKSTSKIRFSMKKDTGKTKAYSTLFK